MKRRNRKRRKINKKKLLLVFIALALLLFLIFKLAVGIKGFVLPKTKESLPIKSEQDVNQEEKKIINIMIDPAKGGSNTGMSTPSGTMSEKEINLDIAKKIQTYISKHKDVRVMLTREYDDDKSLKNRVDLARENETDVFVSIRLNAQGVSNQAEGLDTYYLAPKPVKTSKNDTKSQKKEGKSSEEGSNDEEESKLDSNSKKEKKSETLNAKNKTDDKVKEKKSDEEKSEKQTVVKRKNLSETLAKSIQSTTLSFVEMKDRGVIQNNFDVLNYTDMPSAIVQCGFISNKNDAEKLSNEAFRQELADGISEGLLCFIDDNRNDIIKDRVNYR
ncbi:MAG: N-acetylmuramoyl-L-alanine amidase [Peptostreptococcus sp.]|uniref:N-acetylmuramoyl-L-alanine amidase family protein n=1 Tax=Peptostreptococcus sp. TaxID=1262 RepID=UPI002FCA19E2